MKTDPLTKKKEKSHQAVPVTPSSASMFLVPQALATSPEGSLSGKRPQESGRSCQSPLGLCTHCRCWLLSRHESFHWPDRSRHAISSYDPWWVPSKTPGSHKLQCGSKAFLRNTTSLSPPLHYRRTYPVRRGLTWEGVSWEGSHLGSESGKELPR